MAHHLTQLLPNVYKKIVLNSLKKVVPISCDYLPIGIDSKPKSFISEGKLVRRLQTKYILVIYDHLNILAKYIRPTLHFYYRAAVAYFLMCVGNNKEKNVMSDTNIGYVNTIYLRYT